MRDDDLLPLKLKIMYRPSKELLKVFADKISSYWDIGEFDKLQAYYPSATPIDGIIVDGHIFEFDRSVHSGPGICYRGPVEEVMLEYKKNKQRIRQYKIETAKTALRELSRDDQKRVFRAIKDE